VHLAIFDLDNTLLAGDSDHLWGEYLAEQGLVDGAHYRRENDRFLAAYEAGTLDIYAFLRFSLAVLRDNDPGELDQLRGHFLEDKIAPRVASGAPELLARHRSDGCRLMILTATNRFVTAPIAEMLGVDDLLATEVELRDGRFTGEPMGTPCFREGKVERLQQWLDQRAERAERITFYSDSHNDLPLLERVEHPVAVDPDSSLRAHAAAHAWPVITLRESASPRAQRRASI